MEDKIINGFDTAEHRGMTLFITKCRVISNLGVFLYKNDELIFHLKGDIEEVKETERVCVISFQDKMASSIYLHKKAKKESKLEVGTSVFRSDDQTTLGLYILYQKDNEKYWKHKDEFIKHFSWKITKIEHDIFAILEKGNEQVAVLLKDIFECTSVLREIETDSVTK